MLLNRIAATYQAVAGGALPWDTVILTGGGSAMLYDRLLPLLGHDHVILADETEHIHLANVRGGLKLWRLYEAQALAVLEVWQEAGYSTRHVLTEALLWLEASAEGEVQAIPVEEIMAALEQVGEQLARLQHEEPRRREIEAPEASLEEAFLLSVREAAQPGLRLND